MTDFLRFPHTPHLHWLGKALPREDKILLPVEAKELLADDVFVEEKLDGANLGVSLAPNGQLKVQNRGQYLVQPFAGQFARLSNWLSQHDEALRSVLTHDLILFGDWCAARHSISYDTLPDWFLLFDVYDRTSGLFWSTARRNAISNRSGLLTVPTVMRGKTTLNTLEELVATKQSCYREGPLEGVIVRQDSQQWNEARVKLVRADFTQSMDMHWRKRALEWNLTTISPGKQN